MHGINKRSEMEFLRTHGFTTGLVAVKSGVSISPWAWFIVSSYDFARDGENHENYCEEFVEAPRT